jgi:tetratricopeptide (TPR) repeat protein
MHNVMRLASLAFALALPALALPGLASPSMAQPADPVIDQARALMQANNADKAAEILEKGVETKPNDANRHFWLGQAYGSLAQKANILRQASLASKTKTEFERAVQLDPNLLDARFGLIDYYMLAPGFMGGDPEKARQQAAEIKKRDALMGHRAYASIANREKKPDVARAEYAAMVKEQPNSAQAHYWFGIHLLTGDKNYRAAAESFETAAKLDATFMPAQFQIGHAAALGGGDPTRGIQMLTKYLAYRPDTDEPPIYRAHYWLGMIYERQGKKTEARSEYQIALRLQPGQKDATEALKRVG